MEEKRSREGEGGEGGKCGVRGGPIVRQNFVGPITSVPCFQFSVSQQLQALQAELCRDPSEKYDEELLVDELRVLSEEELVDKALKEAFENTEKSDCLLQTPGEQSSEMQANDRLPRNDGNSCSKDSRIESNSIEHDESTSGVQLEGHNGCNSHKVNQLGSKERKRRRKTDRDDLNLELQSCCVNKVEELAKIKQKQDEDRVAVKLHSFSCNAKSKEVAIPLAEKLEKMRSLSLISSAMKVKSSTKHENIPLRNSEIVLSIEVYRDSKLSRKAQEFQVLGRQTLTELRDNIYCITDQLMQKAGQDNPSGYFLIEDVFCNDLRDPSAIDYSEPILDWLRNSKEEAIEKWECITVSGDPQKKSKALLGSESIAELPKFQARNMHETRFLDLRFRLGSGYLYCHQGDCKHIIVIRDMRLIHPEDEQNLAAYPNLTFQLRPRSRKCNVCRTFQPTKVTVEDKWAKDNPCYFCDSCYFLLHYSEDGSLLYNEFTVYDYHNEF